MSTKANPKTQQLFKLQKVKDTSPHAEKVSKTRESLHKSKDQHTAIGDDEQDMDYETQDNL